jgi:actin-like ATPase involved in cell morphogenesis
MEISIENEKQDETQQERKRIKRKEGTEERSSSIGIDIGTGNIVTAISKNGEASFKLERDAFFEIEKTTAAISMLNKMGANYIEDESKRFLQIIGNQALEMADFFNKNCNRPLANGVISTKEKSALTMIKIILKKMLGNPVTENELCFFSVPAKPIDKDDYNVVYHENVLKSFITSFGFNPIPINEAFAIVWSSLFEEDYTGMAISFGAGMSNICLSYKGMSNIEHQFSVSMGGDFIDECASAAVGLKSSRIQIIKESGVDLLNPKTREETAIKIYYDNLIKYVCDSIEKRFNSLTDVPNFRDPITVIISGGTSKAINFENLFQQQIMSKVLPFKIKQVKLAKDPLNAVAEGCLLSALNYTM